MSHQSIKAKKNQSKTEMTHSSQRRNFVKKLASAAGLTIINPATGFSYNRSAADAFSFIHLTDMHVRRKRQGHLGYKACIADVNKNYATADFVLMGGDLTFDGNYTAKDEFVDQIELYK